jgi:ABC-type multidrug transport system fused ATPase/permease subunit
MENKSNSNKNTEENILLKLKTPAVAISVGSVYVFLMILTLVLLYNHGSILDKTIPGLDSNNSNSNISLTIFATITFTLLILAFLVILLPNFKEIKTLLGQIHKVLYVILYTIFVLLFFRLLPSETLNTYASFFVPVTLVGAVYFFYQAFKTNYILEFNMNYERIKMILLFFSLITLLMIYYLVDPGGFFQKNLGYSMLLTILLSIFSFIYLVIVLTLQTKTGTASDINGGALDFSNYNLFVWFTNIFFILFVILLGVGIRNYPDGFSSNVGVSTAVIIFSMLIVLLWGSILGVNYFPNFSNKILDETKMNLFNKSVLIILGVVISGLLITWLTYNIQHYMGGSTSTFSLTLNILLVLVILTFIYKIMNVKPPEGKKGKSNGLVELITRTILYFPCLFSQMFDKIAGFFVKEYNQTTTGNLYFLGFSMSLFVIYFLFYYVKPKLLLQGGNLLVNKPIQTNTLTTLANYEELTKELNTYTHETLSHLSVLKTYANEITAYNKYNMLSDELSLYNSKECFLYGSNLLIVSNIPTIITIIIILSANYLNSIEGLTIFILHNQGLYSTIKTIFDMKNEFIKCREPYTRITNILDAPEYIYGYYIPNDNNFYGDISFNSLSFKYEKSNEYILNNLNFNINRGDKIAIIGESGCGKSTLSKLLVNILSISLYDQLENLSTTSSVINNVGFVRYDCFPD